MGLAYGQLGNVGAITAATNTALYTVPASTTAVVQFVAANTNTTTNKTFRMAVIHNAGIGSVGSGDYLIYDRTVIPGEVVTITGLTLNAGDTVMVYSSTTGGAGVGMNFHLYGETSS